MIPCADFYDSLTGHGVDFFAGVPDSLLKDFCAYVFDHTPSERNIITPNEGNAVAVAAGHYLATGRPGLVYMQNSGQGNAVNPLMSLADRQVYSIPMLLLIGWRAEPGVPDEPQHRKQGRITRALLKTMGIAFAVLPKQPAQAKKTAARILDVMKANNVPGALIVRKDTFAPYKLREKSVSPYKVSREEAIGAVIASLSVRDIVVSTTGKASRELFEYRRGRKQGHARDFLTVGSMGHASTIALGIALAKPDRNVICLDGDGAALMHLGAMAMIGARRPGRFRHVLLNNGAHESVGGQPTVGFDADFCAVAKACGYSKVLRAETAQEIKQGVREMLQEEGPCFLEIRLNQNARKDLGRPTTSPQDNKRAFMRFLAT